MMKKSLKLIMVMMALPILGSAQQRSGIAFEMNSTFVSEDRAFDLKKENNSTAFLQNTLSPTLTYDYFLVDSEKSAFSLGISQSLNLNSINTNKLDALARSLTQNQPYTLDWQGGSQKMDYSTQLSAKLWLPAGKSAALSLETRGGLRYGGSTGLKINGLDAQTPYMVYEYRTKATQAIWDVRATYYRGIQHVGIGLSVGYGSNGASLGIAVRKIPPPRLIKTWKEQKSN